MSLYMVITKYIMNAKRKPLVLTRSLFWSYDVQSDSLKVEAPCAARGVLRCYVAWMVE